ncbi:MAG: glycosyltransferase family 2 protein [Planctomycetota bacterium]|jgi:dolichol-phosphate mannosyltransferase|nr:glycosyltransferase family 2 protein [Planctomycetota bacterium]
MPNSASILISEIETRVPIGSSSRRSDEMEIATRVSEFAARKSNLVVIIPIWNEGEVILKQLQRMRDASLNIDIVLCDGDSSDGSTNAGVLQSLGVRALLVTDRPGLGTALRMGFGYAIDEGYDGVITVDGNGKDGVEAIPQFVTHLSKGFDFVQGSRFMPGAHHSNTPWERYLGIRCILSPIMSIASGFRYSDPTNGFKALSRRFLLDERLQPLRPVFQQFNLQFYLNYMAPRLGFRVVEIPVSRSYPKGTPTPTKIVGLGAKTALLRQFLSTIFGRYSVKEQRFTSPRHARKPEQRG